MTTPTTLDTPIAAHSALADAPRPTPRPLPPTPHTPSASASVGSRSSASDAAATPAVSTPTPTNASGAATALAMAPTAAAAGSVSGSAGFAQGAAAADLEEEEECRICRCGEYECGYGKLHFPCLCRAPVHAACLEKWVRRRTSDYFPLSLSYSSTYHCEVCLKAYTLPLLTSRFKWVRQRLCGQCSVAFLVEVCFFFCALSLACIGHAIFWLHAFEQEESVSAYVEKCMLGLMNAALTGSLLVLFQRLVQRCHRDGVLYLEARAAAHEQATMLQAPDTAVAVEVAHNNDAVSERTLETGQYAPVPSRFTARGIWSYVYLGVGLGTTAAFELYLVIKAL